MKKTLRCLLILLCGSSLSFAQTKAHSIGLNGGLGISSLRGNAPNIYLDKPDLALCFGLTYRRNLNSRISLRTALNYERKGSRSEIDLRDQMGNSQGPAELHFHYHYLQLPILAQLTFGKKTQFFFNAGPTIGVLWKQRSIFEGSENFDRLELDESHYYNPMDVGIQLGLGVEQKIAKRFWLCIEIYNNLGLLNISKVVNYIGPEWDLKTNASYLRIGLNYQFGRMARNFKR